MRRPLAPVLAPLVVLTLLLAGSLAGSPSVGAAPDASIRSARAVGQEVGDTVTLFSTDGDEEGVFTVTDLTDDFDDTKERTPAGERMVSLDVEIEAAGGEFPVDPVGFNIVDDTGVLWIDIPVTRTDDKESLEAIDLADGDTVEGSVEIVIPSSVEIAKLLYIVDDQRLLTLLDNTAGVEAGDVVDVVTVGGDEAGTITADEVFEDFDDVESGSEPSRDQAIYGLSVTLEATGDEELALGPETFIAVDANGAVYPADATTERTADSVDEFPDLESGAVEPGEEVSGFLTFLVLDDVPVDYVAYIPDARLYPVVDAAGASTDGDASPAADDDPLGPLGPTGDDETPTTDDDGTPVAADGDCTGVADWEDASLELVQEWSDIVGSITTDVTSDDLRDLADDVAKVAEAQADLDVPPVAEELNDLLTEAYEDTVTALTDAADGVDAEDQQQTQDAGAALQDIGESFQTGGDVDDALQDLRDICPDEVDEL